MGKMTGMTEKILLHSCCAPCSAAILEWMLAHDMEPTVFYCNPNIFPHDEYVKRKNELTRHCASLGLEVIDGDWDHEGWLAAVAGLENEPERGLRCQVCFNVRLAEAARCTHERGLGRFTTTLASSRWKSLSQVNAAGLRAAALYDDVTYWDKNWRKDGLQDRRNELLRIHGFYNQQWCGCEFSHRDMLRHRAQKLAREAAAIAEAAGISDS